MKALCSRMLTASVLLLFLVTGLSSKAPLSKLLISGGKIAAPIEVTDAHLLQASNPWFGSFIPQWNEAPQGSSARPPDTAPRYEISFYATFSPTLPPHIIYVVYYAFDRQSQQGFVYLPGAHEEWYSTNTGSIMRPNQDGRWNLASSSWSAQVNAIISSSEPH